MTPSVTATPTARRPPPSPRDVADIAATVPQEQWPITEMNCFGPPRPLPAWLVADGSYRVGEDDAEQLLGLGVSASPTSSPTCSAGPLAAITPGDPVPQYATEELAGVPVVVVTLTGIPDDSSSRRDHVVRYADAERGRAPTDGLRFV